MYTTSDKYKINNLEAYREFEASIKIGNRTLTNEEVISLNIQQSIQQDATFTLGNAVSSVLSLSFLHNDIDIDDKDVIDVKIGLLVDDKYEYIPLGVYNIETLNSNDIVTNIIAYDNMVKFDIPYIEDSENPTVRSIINNLSKITGISLGSDISKLTNYKLASLSSYSCREILGFVAGVLGCNAIIDRSGKFKFIEISKASSINISNGNYFDYLKQNKPYTVNKVINVSDTTLEKGKLTENTVQVTLSNPFVNETILTDIYNKINGFTFYSYELSFGGDLSLDLGDLVSISDKNNNVLVQPILSQSFNYTGGLTSIIKAEGDTKLSNSYIAKSKEEASIDRVQEETKNKFATIETDLESITSKVSETESILISTNEKIDNLEVGGRNLLLKTNEVKKTTGKNTTNQTLSLYDLSSSGKLETNGKKVTLSFKYKISDYAGGDFRIQTQPSVYQSFGTITPAGNGNFEYKRTTTASDYSQNTRVGIRMDNFNGSIEISSMKLEIGSIATAYTPAPEDIETRVSEAESKLTKDSLTTTIGAYYTTSSDVDGIVTSKNYATISEVKQTKDELTAKFDDGYTQGVTTINKGGIKVSQSNYNGFTQMRSDGFYVNNGTENVIKATKDGAEFKGKVTITGGTVNSSTTIDGGSIKTGTIDGSKATITNINASNISSGTISSDRLNIGTLVSKINNGSTTINGDKITTGTVTADKIAIGDFTNYIVLAANSTTANEGGVTEPCYAINKINHSKLTNKLYSIQATDKFLVEGIVKCGSVADTVKIQGVWRTSDGAVVSNTAFTVNFKGVANSFTKCSSYITVSSKPATASYYEIKVFTDNTASGVLLFNPTIRLMNKAEMIVDGAITANKIEANALVGKTLNNGNGTFKVDTNGNMTSSSATITGGSFKIGSNFTVSNTGVLTAKSANFTGTINSGSTITGSAISGGSLTIGDTSAGNFFRVKTDGSFQAGSVDQYNYKSTVSYGNSGLIIKAYDDANEKARTISFDGSGLNVGNTNYSEGWISNSGKGICIAESVDVEGSISTTGSIAIDGGFSGRRINGSGLATIHTNLYLGASGEVRVTDNNLGESSTVTYMPIKASEFRRSDGKLAYINGAGGGTTSAAGALVANGMRTDATDLFIGVDGSLRVTNKNGYNGGNGLTYKPIVASAYNNGSDLIFKKNIKRLDDSEVSKMISKNGDSLAIRTLKDVTVYEYDLVDGEQNQIGLIAQECPQVLRGSDSMYNLDIESANTMTDAEREELIEKDKFGATINLYAMSTMLWKVCQEQQGMIEKLEKRIEELEGK